MLPQGEFRRLLLADSKERQQILEVLFQTEVYRRIEEALKQAAKGSEVKMRDMQRQLQFLLEQGESESVDELSARMEAAHHRLSEILDHLQAMKQREKVAQERLHRGKGIVEKFNELHAAEKSLRSLEEKIQAFADKRRILAQARKAAAIIAEEKALVRVTREEEETAKRLKSAKASLDAARASKAAAERVFQTEKDRQDQRDHTLQRLNQLEDLTQRVKELHEAVQRRILVEKQLNKASGIMAETEQAITIASDRMNQLRELRAEAEKSASQIELLRLKCEKTEKELSHARRLARLLGEEAKLLPKLGKASAALLMKEEQAALARAELKAIEAAWIEGQAAILAQRLVPGSPCPVCGSVEHPGPASFDRSLPTERSLQEKAEKVEELRQSAESLVNEKTGIEKKVFEIRAEIALVRESLGELGDAEPAQLDVQLKAFKKHLRTSEEAADKFRVLSEEVAGLEANLTVAKESRDRAEKAKTEALGNHKAAEADELARLSGIPEGLREISALEKAKVKAQETIKRLEAAFEKAQETLSKTGEALAACEAGLRAAEDAAMEAGRRVIAQTEEFARILREAGFPDAADFRAAKRTQGEIQKLEEQIQAFDQDLSAVGDRVQRAKAATEGLEVPDMNALEVEASKAKEDLGTALKEEAQLAAHIKRIEGLMKAYTNSAAELEALEAHHAVVGRIAQVASGNNPTGINFQRFVLGALLDDVLAAASERLRIMSHQRYSLRRSGDRIDRRQAGGLDLEVEDSYTGVARPVSTLSGGESFLASLSLALGLSDVVQAYAGGIHLDTIFVDEGFGSLDPEALDLALRALVDLQRNGRLVGIISHVPELRERIDARLEVTASRLGSKAQFVIG